MGLIIYADVTCPECYLAARRSDILAAAGASIDFRAVESRPDVPVPGLRLSASDQEALADRFRTLGDLLLPGEELPWAMPALTPKSEAAVSAMAGVAGTPAADDMRRLLFELYWLDGLDIGNPNALRDPLAGPAQRSRPATDPLRHIASVVSVDRGPMTNDAYHRIRAWRAGWDGLGRPPLPSLLTDGATLHGLDALRHLGKLIHYTAADVAAPADDPRRFAREPVRPGASWLSQIGGRWRDTHRLSAGPI